MKTWPEPEFALQSMSLLRHLGIGRKGNPRKAVLVASEPAWQALRTHLLKPDQKERVAFGLLGRAEFAGRIEYYLHRVLPVPDNRCVEQHGYFVEPDPGFVVDCFDAYGQSTAVAFLHAHSHPFCQEAHFSGTDNAYLPGAVESLRDYVTAVAPRRPCRFLRMVTGQNETGFQIEVYDSQSRVVEEVTGVRVVGVNGIHEITRPAAGDGVRSLNSVLSDQDRSRLDRNLRWLGEAGQTRVSGMHVALVGVGGVGTEMVKICRGLGVKRFTLIDLDRVEEANLNRLMWTRSDVGKFKCDVARDFILAADPGAEVNVLELQVEHPDAQTALLQADFILNSLDNDSARLNVQVLAARHLKPLLDLGSGIQLRPGTREVAGMGGQAAFYVPGGACLVCQGMDLVSLEDPAHREARRQIGYVDGTEETPASVVTINSVIAGIAGDLLVKYLTGFARTPTFVSYDALTHEIVHLSIDPLKDCLICGSKGVAGLGLDQEKALPCKANWEILNKSPGPVGETQCLAPSEALEGEGGAVASSIPSIKHQLASSLLTSDYAI